MAESLHSRLSGTSPEEGLRLSSKLASLRLPHLLSNQDFTWSDEQLDTIQAYREAHARNLLATPRDSPQESADEVQHNGGDDEEDLHQRSLDNRKGDVVAEASAVTTTVGHAGTIHRELYEEDTSEAQFIGGSETAGVTKPGAEHPVPPKSGNRPEGTETTKSQTLPGFGDFFKLIDTDVGMQMKQMGQCPAPQGTPFAADNVAFQAVSVPCRPFIPQAQQAYHAQSRRKRNMRSENFSAHEGNSMSLRAYLEARGTARSSQLCCNPGAGRDAELRLSGFPSIPDKWKYFSKDWGVSKRKSRRSLSAASKVNSLLPAHELLGSEVTSFFDLASQ